MRTIRIANPRPGQAQFTSDRAARKYVERRKIARWTTDAQDEIFFFHGSLVPQQQQAAVAEVKAAARRLGRVVFWNGDDPDEFATHRPGEVVC